MRELHDHSTRNQLTPGHREALATSLFDENPDCPGTVEGVNAEFGLAATLAGVGRFYRRRARQRQAGELNAKILGYFGLFSLFPLISAEGVFFYSFLERACRPAGLRLRRTSRRRMDRLAKRRDYPPNCYPKQDFKPRNDESIKWILA